MDQKEFEARAQRLAKANRLIASVTTLYQATSALQKYPAIGGALNLLGIPGIRTMKED